jgi:hypothetical protein
MTRKHAKVVFVLLLGIGLLLILSSLYSFTGIAFFKQWSGLSKFFFGLCMIFFAFYIRMGKYK